MSDPLYSVVKAVVADLEGIKAIARQHSEELGWLPGGAYRIAIGAGDVFVLRGESCLLGYVWLRCGRKCAKIYQLAVAKDKGRRGLGSALVQFALTECQRRGAVSVSLLSPTDLGLAPFWERLGFRQGPPFRGRKRALTSWSHPVGGLALE